MTLSPQDEGLLKRVYLQLSDEPLKPDDPRYVPIYSRADGEDPVARMQTHIEWTAVQSLQFFSGFRGSGKTTELFRLREFLQAKGCLVLYADALDYVNAAEPIDIVTMLLSVAGAFSDRLEEQVGLDTLGESFWTRINNYLRNTTLQVSEATAKVGAKTPASQLAGEMSAGLDLKIALKTAPSFQHRLQEFLNNRLGELKRQVDAFVENGIQAVRKKLGQPDKPIVFLFDQFEQLRGSLGNEQSVIQSVERLFASYRGLIQLPYIHVIYTVPAWLRFVLPGEVSIETLPTVRLCNNDTSRTPYPAGRTLFRELIVKRFQHDGLRRVFGAEEATDLDLIGLLIDYSGGHLRDLLRLLREVIVLARTWTKSLPVDQNVIDRAVMNVRNDYLPIAQDDAQWLAEIDRQRKPCLPSTDAADVGRFSRFLDTHLVLFLTNGEEWYDIHPLIRQPVAEIMASAADSVEHP